MSEKNKELKKEGRKETVVKKKMYFLPSKQKTVTEEEFKKLNIKK